MPSPYSQLDDAYERDNALRELPNGDRLPKGELDILIHEAWSAPAQARRENDRQCVEALSKRIEMLQRRKYDGHDNS